MLFKCSPRRDTIFVLDDGYPGDNSVREVTYTDKGGSKVVISLPLNPWQVLGLNSSELSYEAIQTAFKKKINQPIR